jgi:hypothetical protein
VLHDQEQQSTLEESIVGETQQHAPEEQEALEEQEAREEQERSEEWEGSSSEDGDKEGVQQGGGDHQQHQINYKSVEF